MEDLPPPPYSVHDESRPGAHGSLPLATQAVAAYRTILPDQDVSGVPELAGHNIWTNARSSSHSPRGFADVSPVSLPSQNPDLNETTSDDLYASGFVSALPYFELRSYNQQQRPIDTYYHHMILDTNTQPDQLPFPQPNDRWLSRGVDNQDWATFLNHLFPNYGSNRRANTATELEADAGLDMQGLSLENEKSLRAETRPLMENYSSSSSSAPASRSVGTVSDERLRRLRVNAVTAQWNEGFFEPRGLFITMQLTSYLNTYAPILPTALREQQRGTPSGVLQNTPPAQYQETLLHQAVGKGSKSKVRDALAQGDDLEALNKKYETALFRAVIRNEKTIAQILLEKGANPAAHPIGEYTPLQHAASHDNKSMLKLLIEKSSREEIEEMTPAGETALYLAVTKRNSACVEILLENGANINSRPIGKESMLNSAVSATQSSVVKLLLQKGAFTEERNGNGDTPLSRAISKGESKIAKLLLEHGASASARTGQGEPILSIAVGRGDTSVIKMLLEHSDTNIELPNSKVETPLYQAIKKSDNSIVQLLLAKGANPATTPPGADSPLCYVVSKGQTAMTHLLLERGIDPETRNSSNETPLFQSVSRGDTAISTLLIQKGGDVNTTNAAGESVLYRAVSRGDVSLVSILLAHGACPEGKTEDSEVETKNSNGETPLYRAVSRGDVAVVSLLLAKGASPGRVSGRGETALEYGLKKGNKAIVHLLQVYNRPSKSACGR